MVQEALKVIDRGEECLKLGLLGACMGRKELEKWGRGTEEVTVLFIVHGRVEAFSMGALLEAGFKLFIHLHNI